MVPRKARREITSQATVLQTDTGVRGEYPQVRERTLVKELGKFTPYVRKKECRRKAFTVQSSPSPEVTGTICRVP